MEKRARTKLADHNISWKEEYTPATKRFQDMYEDIIGKNSYFRWEGVDRDTKDEYFVVVGPAKMKTPSAKWFAGSRKLPSEWAAAGKYFSSLGGALQYAIEKWGVPTPKKHPDYTAQDLKGIGKKMEAWREKHSNGESVDVKKASTWCDFDLIVHEAMGGERWVQREGYFWWDVDNIASDPDFIRKVEQTPYLEAAQGALLKEDMQRRRDIARNYGEEYRNADFYKVWLAHKDDQGTYLVAVGPYLAQKYNKDTEAKDKFGFFHKKLNIAVDNEVTRRVQDLIQEYEKQYGVLLDDQDVKVSGLDRADPYVGLSEQGRNKLRNSDEYQSRLEYYNAKNPNQALKEYQKRKKQYQQALKDGTALVHDMPPPPRVDLFRLPIGQKGFTAITKSKPGEAVMNIAIPESVSRAPATTVADEEQYGFDSMHEAVAYGAAAIPKGGFPIPDPSTIPNTTNEDLRQARLSQIEREKEERTRMRSSDVTVEQDIEQEKLQADIDPVTTPDSITAPEPTQESTPQSITQSIDAMPGAEFADQGEVVDDDEDVDLYEQYIKRKQKERQATSNTLTNLIKLAQAFDDEGRDDAAEAIHKILRKHIKM